MAIAAAVAISVPSGLPYANAAVAGFDHRSLTATTASGAASPVKSQSSRLTLVIARAQGAPSGVDVLALPDSVAAQLTSAGTNDVPSTVLTAGRELASALLGGGATTMQSAAPALSAAAAAPINPWVTIVGPFVNVVTAGLAVLALPITVAGLLINGTPSLIPTTISNVLSAFPTAVAGLATVPGAIADYLSSLFGGWATSMQSAAPALSAAAAAPINPWVTIVGPFVNVVTAGLAVLALPITVAGLLINGTPSLIPTTISNVLSAFPAAVAGLATVPGAIANYLSSLFGGTTTAGTTASTLMTAVAQLDQHAPVQSGTSATTGADETLAGETAIGSHAGAKTAEASQPTDQTGAGSNRVGQISNGARSNGVSDTTTGRPETSGGSKSVDTTRGQATDETSKKRESTGGSVTHTGSTGTGQWSTVTSSTSGANKARVGIGSADAGTAGTDHKAGNRGINHGAK